MYKLNTYNIKSKYVLNITDIVDDAWIKSSKIQIYQGYLLEHILKSYIKEQYILIIIEHILLFLSELNMQGYFNVDIRPSNIMIDHLLNVKILSIKTVINTSTNEVPITTYGYSAPELYTSKYDKRCDLYSIGIMAWELINGKSISDLDFDRNIDFKVLNRPFRCSLKFWKIILKATKTRPEERYKNPHEMLDDIYKCRKYKAKNNQSANITLGTVTTLSEKDIKKEIYSRSTSAGETTILNEIPLMEFDEGFSMSTYTKEVYLIRMRTHEMIAINKTVFTIGKKSEKVDFSITDNVAISRVHVSIISEDNRYYIQNNDPVNGTYLNDTKLASNEKIEVVNGDVIKLADEEFLFKVL